VQHTAVNPWPWSQQYGYNQAELIEGHKRQLFCAGQTAIDADGHSQHGGDMAAQLTLALDNLDAVLAAGDMSLADVVRLTIYTTDVDGLFPHYGILAERLATAGVTPASTLVGVARLAFPELLVEIEATAVQ
jgi:enamine deaminase RidA (YjgF/YER057c/UK114 family)